MTFLKNSGYPPNSLGVSANKIKDYSSYSYNHLNVAGIPSVIDWTRRRYVCKECGKSFSEPSPFGPENFHQSYAVLNAIALDLHNVRMTYKDIAHKYHISDTIVRMYADSFIRARVLYCLNNKLFYCLATCLYSRKREHKKCGTYTKQIVDTLIQY